MKDGIILKKELYCVYDSSVDFENALGCLRFFIPTTNGYINYNLVRSVNKRKNVDMWRLSKAYAFDDNFENEYELTPPGAEWDMALRLSGRPDFIGGYAHGDEIYTSFFIDVDGKNVDAESLKSLTPFKKIIIKVQSIGYDPDDSVTQALKHFKEYVITEKGIALKQKVEWLNDYTLGTSYMAMMPPIKTLTDSVCTDVDTTPKEAKTNYGYTPGAKSAHVFGTESGIKFSMSVSKYPSLCGGDKFLLTDNKGGLYNKMYFVVCDGHNASKGEVWETTTEYSITN